nr:unnamed protein product [Digitaria exilis]
MGLAAADENPTRSRCNGSVDRLPPNFNSFPEWQELVAFAPWYLYLAAPQLGLSPVLHQCSSSLRRSEILRCRSAMSSLSPEKKSNTVDEENEVSLPEDQMPLGLDLRPDRGRPTLMVGGPLSPALYREGDNTTHAHPQSSPTRRLIHSTRDKKKPQSGRLLACTCRSSSPSLASRSSLPIPPFFLLCLATHVCSPPTHLQRAASRTRPGLISCSRHSALAAPSPLPLPNRISPLHPQMRFLRTGSLNPKSSSRQLDITPSSATVARASPPTSSSENEPDLAEGDIMVDDDACSALVEKIRDPVRREFARILTNGQVERANGMILQGLKPRIHNKLKKFGHKWVQELPSVIWSLRTTPSRATRFSPYFLVFGAEAILPTDLEYGSPRLRAYQEQRNCQAREDSLDQVDEARDQSLRRQQARRIRHRDLCKGDLVLRLRHDNRGRHKLSPPWEGPYIVAEVLKPGTYKLADENGQILTNAWNIQQLRLFAYASRLRQHLTSLRPSHSRTNDPSNALPSRHKHRTNAWITPAAKVVPAAAVHARKEGALKVAGKHSRRRVSSSIGLVHRRHCLFVVEVVGDDVPSGELREVCLVVGRNHSKGFLHARSEVAPKRSNAACEGAPGLQTGPAISLQAAEAACTSSSSSRWHGLLRLGLGLKRLLQCCTNKSQPKSNKTKGSELEPNQLTLDLSLSSLEGPLRLLGPLLHLSRLPLRRGPSSLLLLEPTPLLLDRQLRRATRSPLVLQPVIATIFEQHATIPLANRAVRARTELAVRPWRVASAITALARSQGETMTPSPSLALHSLARPSSAAPRALPLLLPPRDAQTEPELFEKFSSTPAPKPPTFPKQLPLLRREFEISPKSQIPAPSLSFLEHAISFPKHCWCSRTSSPSANDPELAGVEAAAAAPPPPRRRHDSDLPRPRNRPQTSRGEPRIISPHFPVPSSPWFARRNSGEVPGTKVHLRKSTNGYLPPRIDEYPLEARNLDAYKELLRQENEGGNPEEMQRPSSPHHYRP